MAANMQNFDLSKYKHAKNRKNLISNLSSLGLKIDTLCYKELPDYQILKNIISKCQQINMDQNTKV